MSFDPFDTIVDVPIGYRRRANGQIMRNKMNPKIKGKKAVKQAKKLRQMMRKAS